MGQTNRLIPAWDKGRTDFEKFQLKLKAWCYIEPEEVHFITKKVADFLRGRQEGLLVKWVVTTQEPTPEGPISPLPDRKNLAYMALNLTFTTTDGGSQKLANEKDCRSYYKDLTNKLLWPSFEVFRQKIGIELVTWDLAAAWGWSPAFSLYWLGGWTRMNQTKQKQEQPAYNIGYALRGLTSVPELGNHDHSHDRCPKGAVLECIKHLLRKAQRELAEVRQAASSSLKQNFSDSDCNGCPCPEQQRVMALIQKNLQHTIATSTSIQAIKHLMDQNVGIGHSQFFLMRFLRKIFNQPKYLNLVVDDNTFSTKKQTMSGHATYLKIMSRTVAGHVRLRNNADRNNLRAQVQRAAPGTLEQTQLMRYFGLVAARVGEQAQHDAALDKVCGRYFDAFDNVVSDIETLIQILDKEYAEKGEKMFRRKRSAVSEGTPRCLLEKAALNQKLYKLENDSDSELGVEYNEKC